MCPSILNVSESTVQNWYENERDEIVDDYSLAAVDRRWFLSGRERGTTLDPLWILVQPVLFTAA